MLGDVAHNLHGGEIRGIARGNRLGPGIEVASLPELGPGGSWSTCTNGCHLEPPQEGDFQAVGHGWDFHGWLLLGRGTCAIQVSHSLQAGLGSTRFQ
eukprot:symbB.v1.2.001706.t2/scaffold61.1/size362833/5